MHLQIYFTVILITNTRKGIIWWVWWLIYNKAFDHFDSDKQIEEKFMQNLEHAMVEKLTDHLKAKFSKGDFKDMPGWKSPALDVIDCVLSLNRRYEGFVLPRVKRFARRHPDVSSLQALLSLIKTYKTHHEFSIYELDYRDEKRANTLVGVIQYLISIQEKYEGATELARLENWARSVKPSDYLSVGVPGFGISGFQYLRMRFGADTVKPDVHIINFVSEVVGRRIDGVLAITVLEEAARKANLPVRQLDGTIWEERAKYKGVYD